MSRIQCSPVVVLIWCFSNISLYQFNSAGQITIQEHQTQKCRRKQMSFNRRPKNLITAKQDTVTMKLLCFSHFAPLKNTYIHIQNHWGFLWWDPVECRHSTVFAEKLRQTVLPPHLHDLKAPRGGVVFCCRVSLVWGFPGFPGFWVRL